MTKTLTTLATQMGAEVDFYFKKGLDGQQEMFDRLRQLSQLDELADMTNDYTLKTNVLRILEAKIDLIASVDPQSGRMLREYFLNKNDEM
jgi:hypothetical protein